MNITQKETSSHLKSNSWEPLLKRLYVNFLKKNGLYTLFLKNERWQRSFFRRIERLKGEDKIYSAHILTFFISTLPPYLICRGVSDTADLILSQEWRIFISEYSKELSEAFNIDELTFFEKLVCSIEYNYQYLEMTTKTEELKQKLRKLRFQIQCELTLT